MAVSELVNSVIANGNNSARTFSFSPVIIGKSSDIVVVKRDVAGNETPLFEGSSSTTYSVSVSDFPGTGSIDYPAVGGTLLQTGESVSMRSVRDLTQAVDLENQGGYFADTQEGAFDKLTYIAQQQQVDIDKSLKFPPTDTPGEVLLPTSTQRANKALIFDVNGAIDVGGISSQLVSIVDETSNDPTKNKIVSNLLMLQHERARKQSAGVVRMIVTTQGANFYGIQPVFAVYKEDGSELDITGTTTFGLQEAIYYANDNGFNLIVEGGGTKPLYPNPIANGGALGTNPFATVISTTVVTVTHTAHGLVTGDALKFTEVTGPVNGIPTSELETFGFITKVDDNSYTFTSSTNATSTGAGGGTTVRFQLKGKNVSVITCTTGLIFPPIQNKFIEIRSCLLDFTTDTGWAITFDSAFMFQCRWPGSAIIVSSTYAGGVRFLPTNDLPEDSGGPSIGACEFEFGTISARPTTPATVSLDTTNAGISGNVFNFAYEIGFGLNGLEVIGNASRVFQQNIISCPSVHDAATVGVSLGVGTAGAEQMRANTFNFMIKPASGADGMHVWCRDNIIDVSTTDDAGTNTVDGIVLKSSAKRNTIRAGKLHGTNRKINDVSGLQNIVHAEGFIGANVNRGGTDQTGIVTATWTRIQFGTEIWDVGSHFDAASNNDWQPSLSGKVRIMASVGWVVTVDQSLLSIAIYKNGASILENHVAASGTGANQGPMIIAETFVGSENDVFEIRVKQETGGNQDIEGDIKITWAMFERIG